MCETAVELKILPQSGCDIQERLGSFTFTAVMSILVKSKNKTHHHHPGAFRHTDEEEGKIKSHWSVWNWLSWFVQWFKKNNPTHCDKTWRQTERRKLQICAAEIWKQHQRLRLKWKRANFKNPDDKRPRRVPISTTKRTQRGGGEEKTAACRKWQSEGTNETMQKSACRKTPPISKTIERTEEEETSCSV